MLSCISVGISKYKHKQWEDIPCAGEDAKAVYGAFQEIMGEDFNDAMSICLTDIGASDFEILLEAISSSVSSNYEKQVLVIYFSGHGNMNDEHLELLFPEYNGEKGRRDDSFGVERFREVFRLKNIRLLLILDCCYSGEALKIANSDIGNTEISVLTATDGAHATRFEPDGSLFAKALCKGIHEIALACEAFTLDELVERMHSDGYTDLCVNRGAASEVGLVFRNSVVVNDDERRIPSKFVDKIYESSALEREALWYSLGSFPNSVVYDTCCMYFGKDEESHKDRIPEASWLVRRAIGSTMAGKAGYRPMKDLLMELLESAYWQEQCIALIGLRYLVRTDQDVCDKIEYLVYKSKIRKADAVWLACLYLSDNKTVKWSILTNSCLVKSAWGMIEICKAFGLCKDLERLKSIQNQKYFLSELEEECKRLNGNSEVEFESYIYTGKQRGRLPKNTQAKFLLSALYGNWRNQVIINLKPYFDSKTHEEVMEDLRNFGKIHNAERKMALFNYLSKETVYANKYYEAVEWGLSDPQVLP